MSESERPRRRTLFVGLAVVGLAPLAGCMTKPWRAVNADGAAAVAENFDNAGQVRVLKSKTAELLGELGVSQDEKLHQWVMDRVPMLPQRDLNMLHLLCKDLARRFGRE